MDRMIAFLIPVLLCLAACAGDNTPATISPAAETTISGPAFFVGKSEVAGIALAGNALWITDGTADGTRLVKVINPDRTDGLFGELGKSSRGVFFTYRDVSTPSLWFSDGTDTGTRKLADLFFDSRQFAVANDILYFSSYAPASGEELWRSDGTPEGTYLLKDINSASSYPSNLMAANGLLFFEARDLSGAVNPWVSDGTEAGTLMLGNVELTGSGFVPVGNMVFFQGYDPTYGSELWVSDGSIAGTHMVKDINPLPASSNPYQMTSFSGQLYFAANDGSGIQKFWKSDGTEAGTVLADDAFPAVADIFMQAATSTTIFFMQANPDGGVELWGTDGTAGGGKLLKNLYPGESAGIDAYKLHVFKDKFYFVAWNGSGTRFDIWQSDGSPEGTAVVTDLLDSKYDIHPPILTGFGVGVTFLEFIEAEGELCLGFGGVGTQTITHLWATDGTEAGTYLLKDIYAEPLP